jgi:hypothetical protein
MAEIEGHGRSSDRSISAASIPELREVLSRSAKQRTAAKLQRDSAGAMRDSAGAMREEADAMRARLRRSWPRAP